MNDAAIAALESIKSQAQSIQGQLQSVQDQAAQAIAALKEQSTDIVIVLPGQSLQAALDKGGAIEVEGAHEGTFMAFKPGTRLVARAGASIHGLRAEALIVPPGSSDIRIDGAFTLTSSHDQAVLRLGANDDTQTRTADEPFDLYVKGVKIPTHRGKRGIEINARGVLIEDCDVRDLWDPALRDSQAIGIANSSGFITVRGGHFEAGSENIIVGGDVVKMPGVVPSDLLFENLELVKPLSWRTDGVRRAVKNLFELKTGKGVILRGSRLSGCWTDSQTGNAFVFTPTRDGQLTNILVEDCEITNVGSGMQVQGRADRYFTPTRTSLIFQRNKVTVNHALTVDGMPLGGRGWFCEASGEPASIFFRENDISVSGTTLVSYKLGIVMESDGSRHEGGKLGLLEMTSNRANVPRYGISLDGYRADGSSTSFPNGGPNKEGFASVQTLEVFDNTFRGAPSLFKQNFPENVWE